MEVNGEAKPFDEGSQVFLSENTGNHSSQDVTRAPSRHTRIAGWVDVNGSVRRRNDRPISLEHNVCIPRFRELLRDFHAIRHDILDTFSDEARHLAGMGREHSPAEIAVKTSQSIQTICIDDHLRAARSEERRVGKEGRARSWE